MIFHVSLIIGISLLIYLYFKFFVFTYWKRDGIFQYPQTIPFGLALPLFWEQKHIGDIFFDIYMKARANGQNFAGFYLFTRPLLLITDPEDIKNILVKDFQHFKSRGFWCNDQIDPMSANLFGFPPEEWKRMRTKVSSFFSPMRMKIILPAMQAFSPALIEVIESHLDQNESINIRDIIWRFTSTILGSCVFGYDCDSMKNPKSDALVVGRDIFDPNVWHAWKRPLFFLMPELLRLLRVSTTSKFSTDFFRSLVKDSIKFRVNKNVRRADFMQILIDLRKNQDANVENDDGLTLDEMAAQCWVFFAGGFDTAATLVSLCLLLHTLEKHEGKFTFEALNDMIYTEKVVKETLRKYPVLPFLNRECTSDTYTFPNTNITLKKGDKIVISSYGLQRDSEHYPNPEKFDPERFSSDNYVNPHTYLPFGEGPRNCIGLRMGTMQGKLTIAILLSKFKFSLNDRTKLPFQMAKNIFTFTVDGGIWLDAEKVQ